MKTHFILFFLCTVLSLNFLIAQEEEIDKNKWTPDDIINTESIRSVQISPDNKMVVWTKRKGLKKEDKFVSDLYLTRLDTKKDSLFRTIQLTNGKDNDFAPFFSKDSETIYFLSSRDKGKKLWSLSTYGGEAQEVHEFKDGISNIQWLDENNFTFISNDGKTLYEQELKGKKDNVVVVEDEAHWTKNRVYQFNLKEKEVTRLTENEYPITTYSLSKDGKWMVYATRLSRHYASDGLPNPKFYIQNIADGTRTEILEGLQTPYNFQFTADHKGFYFIAVLSSNPEWDGAGVSEVYYYDLGSNNYQKVDLDWKWGMEGNMQVVGNDILVGLANGTTNILTFYKKNGTTWQKSTIDFGDKNEHVANLAIAKDFSKIVYQHSTSAQLPKYYVADLSQSANQLKVSNEMELVKTNKKLSKKPITKYEVMKWKGWNEEEVDGLLFYPEDFETGKRYPLIISIHGGPSGSDMDAWSERWSTYPQIFAQKGAFVFKPNYHGSSHHGQKFVESIKGHYYDLELEDILKGIDVLANKGYIDKDKMGVMGWSNGAILATMMTVRYPDLFKVCAAGAGDVNWTSDFGTCRFGVTFDQSYFGGAPWDNLDGKTYNEKYILKSPLFEMEKVKTPTIIFHGSEDRAVPRDQGWEYYRALQQIDKAPVRFLWFPGQPHGLRKITHQQRKMKEEIAWIDNFLFKTYEPENETFKKESPIANLLKKDKLAREDGLFGKKQDGQLIPEVALVKKDSISIGVLEVTNAQLAAFDSEHSYAREVANYPAKVSYITAQNYIKWLNQKTDKTYRLPSAAEAKALHKKAKKVAAKGNTLAYWAGYELTKDEVNAFKRKVAEVKQSLIKEVASFKATKVGEATIYDLGGNLAEYAKGGSTYGFSAYDFADSKASKGKTSGGFIGIRVVREE